LLRSGLADQVDVAVLKFCYVDFTTSTDVDQLFREYRKTLDALERDFPRVTFLHSTAPLMVHPSGWKGNLKAMLGRDDNVTRERYSALVREAYGAAHLFDIAAIEGTAPDGTRQAALYAAYTTDGGHLNEGGSAVVAAGLLRLVAAAGQSRR
jgi:lysophospholipase L1-like esterase